MTTTHQPNTTTAVSANMAALRRFVDEVLNLGHYETMADVIHPAYRYYGPDGSQIQGSDGLRYLIGEFRQGFSDLTAHVIDEIEQGQRIALTMQLTGTHDGDFGGMAPTGARFELPIAVITRFADERIIEDREYYDTTTLLAQLSANAPGSPNPTQGE